MNVIRYSARSLSEAVVTEFAKLAGYGVDTQKAKRALSRCLARALFEVYSPKERERWRFRHRGATFHVFVENELPVRILKVVSGD